MLSVTVECRGDRWNRLFELGARAKMDVALDGNGSGREKGVQLIATARLSELSLRLAPLLVS